MKAHKCLLIGAPVDCGKRLRGCMMGPDALRTAGLAEALSGLGHDVQDRGNLAPAAPESNPAQNPGQNPGPDAAPVPVSEQAAPQVHALAETIAWTRALIPAARAAAAEGFAIFMGGDHAMALGTVAGVAAHARAEGRPLFVLWLDAHSDFHTPRTTASGHLHGTPLGYVTGQPGFEGFPPLPAPVPAANVCLFGIRSVDAPERAALSRTDMQITDMRAIDEHGIRAPLTAFLDRVAAAGGMLHVSLDVDFLDPAIAPAVGTTVPGGATVREAHLVMELLHDSGLATSLDIVELNPFLDTRGQTARLMVDLAASLLGRRVFDRPTRSHV